MRALELHASFGELYLELAQPMLTIFTAMIMCVHYELANMWMMYRYIHTNIHTYMYIHIYKSMFDVTIME